MTVTYAPFDIGKVEAHAPEELRAHPVWLPWKAEPDGDKKPKKFLTTQTVESGGAPSTRQQIVRASSRLPKSRTRSNPNSTQASASHWGRCPMARSLAASTWTAHTESTLFAEFGLTLRPELAHERLAVSRSSDRNKWL